MSDSPESVKQARICMTRLSDSGESVMQGGLHGAWLSDSPESVTRCVQLELLMPDSAEYAMYGRN
jgi:hypothetical protein